MQQCFVCGAPATAKNVNGISVCKNHKHVNITVRCPICKEDMEIRTGKYGEYFVCIFCNKNWSRAQMRRFI